LRSVTGDLVFGGGDAIRGDNPRTPYDYFMTMLPLDALIRVLKLPSEKLQGEGKHVVTVGEIPKNFGISPAAVTLGSSCRNTALVPPAFGTKTGMPLVVRDGCA
jgi:hypothetical protein